MSIEINQLFYFSTLKQGLSLFLMGLSQCVYNEVNGTVPLLMEPSHFFLSAFPNIKNGDSPRLCAIDTLGTVPIFGLIFYYLQKIFYDFRIELGAGTAREFR